MDATQLRNEADRHRREAISKGDQANRLNNDALGFRALDEFDQAQRAQDQAAELDKQAKNEEQQAIDAERRLAEIKQRAHEIEVEQAALESRKSELDKEKNSILGTSGSLF
jgi:chromosome segregation ATPase